MWLDHVIKWFLPREEHFFDLLERGADCVARAGRLLKTCCGDLPYDARVEIVEQMREIEHEADGIIVEVYEALNRTFVTPIDRSDIYHLASDLEAITDDIFANALQIVVHALDDLPQGSTDISDLVCRACEEIHIAVGMLRSMKAMKEIRDRCKIIKQLEHDGDQIFRLRTAEIFRNEKDAVHLIKHKEFLEGLERTLDRCDDMGNALETLVIKNS